MLNFAKSMADHKSSNEDLIISSCTWDKITTSLTNNGFREGANAGKEAVFQDGFDTGYAEGFQIGLSIGFVRGVLSILNQNDVPATRNVNCPILQMDQSIFLENPIRNVCQLCIEKKRNTDEDLNVTVDYNIDEAICHQRLITTHSLHKLQQDYANLFSSIGLTWK